MAITRINLSTILSSNMTKSHDIISSCGLLGVDQDLGDSDCPLTWQCRWNDPEKFRFEMRCRDEGSVRVGAY